MPSKKKFRYDESYIQLGFVVTNRCGEDKPQGVLCHKVLASSSLKPCKLKRHLETHHPNSKNKVTDFFKRHGQSLENCKVEKLKQVSLPNNSASRQIAELSNHILSQVVSKIQHSKSQTFTFSQSSLTK